MSEDHWGRTIPMEAVSRGPCQDECTHCQKVKGQAGRQKVKATAVMATDGWDCTTLRMVQLEDHNIGPVLWELEAGQHWVAAAPTSTVEPNGNS